MAKFIYNNIKNANTNHIFFKLNCKYYFYIFYEKNLDLYSKLRIAEELSLKL